MSSGPSENAHIFYVLELQHAGLDVNLLLNDIEIVRADSAEQKASQQKIDGWLVRGENEIRLLAGLPATGQTGALLDLKCLLFRGPHGRQPGESEALARFAERDRSKFPAADPQQVWRSSFTADPYYGPWRWERGYRIELSRGVLAEVMRLLRRVTTALNSGDAETLGSSFRVSMEERSRAYDLRLDRLQEQAKAWCDLWNPMRVSDPKPEDYSFTVEGERRLLRIERKDKGRVFSFDKVAARPGPERIYLAQTADEGWIVVR